MEIPKNKSLAVLIGAGAIKNSWLPIQKAIISSDPISSISSDAVNCYFARLIYLLRWSSTVKTEENDYGFQTFLSILNTIKNSIYNELKTSQERSEITTQDQFNEIVAEIIASEFSQLMLVSTNWDTVFEDALIKTEIINRLVAGKVFAVHIHGIYNDPKTIYLPTEVCQEPYRSNEEMMNLRKLNYLTMQQINQAEVLLIYGLSLSPLDAELIQILSAGLHKSSLQLVIIVDLNTSLVKERLINLLEYPNNIRIVEYSPMDLKKESN